MQGGKNEFLFDQFPIIDKSPIYKVFKKKSSVEESQTKEFYAIGFEVKNVKDYGLEQTIKLNKKAFYEAAASMRYTENLLGLDRYLGNEFRKFFQVESYTMNLEKFLDSQEKNSLSENKAIQIFEQLIQGIFCMQKAGYMCYNVRPEHFVLVNQSWKLKCLILLKQPKKPITSEYFWRKQYQAPEAYQKNIDEFSQPEHEKMIVWNIGSLFLNLLTQQHFMNSQKAIFEFQKQNFDIKALKVLKHISKSSEQFLRKTLSSNPQKRVSLEELWELEPIRQKVKKVHLKIQTHKQFQKEINGSEKKKKKFMQMIKQLQEKEKDSLIIVQNESLINIISSIIGNQEFPIFGIEQNFLNAELNTPSIFKKKAHDSENEENIPLIIKKMLKRYEFQCLNARFLIRIGYRLSNTLLSQQEFEKAFLCLYALNFMSLILLNQAKQSLQIFQNIYNFNQKDWEIFGSTGTYSALKNFFQQNLKECEKIFFHFLHKSNEFIRLNEIKTIDATFFNTSYHGASYQGIKQVYRNILLESLFFLNKEPKKNVRQIAFICYSLNFKKSQNFEEDFLSWMHQDEKFQNVEAFNLRDYEQFLLKSDIRIINRHFRALERKYMHQ